MFWGNLLGECWRESTPGRCRQRKYQHPAREVLGAEALKINSWLCVKIFPPYIWAMRNHAVYLCFCLLIVACRSHSDSKFIPAFYYWQTSNEGYDYFENNALLDSLDVRKIYLRMFDVAWDEARKKPVPAGPYRGGWFFSNGREAVPVVFVTNETLQHLDSSGCADLAQRIARKTNAMLNRLANKLQADAYWYYETEQPFSPLSDQANEDSLIALGKQWRGGIREFQIDCDWSPSTRDKFFYLLNQLKPLFPGMKITCTIRLHQFKHFDKTGVPPVERGILMCYNVDDIKDPATTNSIFNHAEARKYLEGAKSYPLPLDVALPAFGWGVLFHAGQFKCIVPEAVFWKNKSEFEEVKPALFRAKTDFTLNDQYVREGDLLRFETPDEKELLKTIELLKKQKLASPLTISFFHLDNERQQDETIEYFENLLAAFR